MRAEAAESGEEKAVQVTVRLSPYLYSRMALLAHRHEQPLGDAIREALHAYVDFHLDEDEAQ
jgi:predicted DNA-binding protein